MSVPHLPERYQETCPDCGGWVWHRSSICDCKGANVSVPKVGTSPPESPREMVARWLRENPGNYRFMVPRSMLEDLLKPEPVKPVCDACGSPRKADGCCSRSQCYNSE